MDDKKTQLLKARLQAIISSIDDKNSQSGSEHISWSLATDFNKILKEFCDRFPEYREQFPEAIPGRFARRLGKAEATFLDLRVKSEQVVKIVQILIEG